MKLCIAATFDLNKYNEKALDKCKYILESFYYIKDWQIPYIHKAELFLLDSGAFSFMSSGKEINFDKYLEDYAAFINKHNVKYFFELDIDAIVGYKKVLEYRKKLELLTGKKCIPVWHKSRGMNIESYAKNMITLPLEV